jgi:transposase-like protein
MAKPELRDPARERFWRQALSAWRTSGLSVREFCGRRDLTETAFYFWRKELRRRDGERAARPAMPTFVPVTVVPTPTAAVEVRCPSGHVVSVSSCDGSILRSLFAALAPVPPC